MTFTPIACPVSLERHPLQNETHYGIYHLTLAALHSTQRSVLNADTSRVDVFRHQDTR